MGLHVVDQLTMYSAYHRHPLNKVIHIIFVPSIVFSLLTIAMCYPVDLNFDGSKISFPINPIGLAGTAILMILSVLIEPYVSVILGAEVYGMYLANKWILQTYGRDLTLKFGILLQIVSWGSQFVGHGVFEGRKPALVDNLLQVFIAPLFVLLEILFSFGYRPALHKEVNKNVENYVNTNFKNEKKAK
eukprot:TRINITY_DN345_c0_g1_i1.p1 TRINITY_DN345_c0_g1~~TRINITY_DN345_c0_g1_i1.p1  ORF type:complete len:188 (+),score=30.31 TRINITY_DN345_c0_g1_i1:281-844(+)